MAPIGEANEDGEESQIQSELKKLRLENYFLRKENGELRAKLGERCGNSNVEGAETVPKRSHDSCDLPLEHQVEAVQAQGSLVNERDHGSECESGAEIGVMESTVDKGHLKGSSVSAEADNVCHQKNYVSSGHHLSANAIRRYSRQLLVPSFGVAGLLLDDVSSNWGVFQSGRQFRFAADVGQERLLKSSVLIVGCGGLGSPIALYLAAAGTSDAASWLDRTVTVGRVEKRGNLGLVDHDAVELSNLHRQIIHTESSVGEAKVRSAALACSRLNSSVQIVEYGYGLKASNALEIISNFDVVVDATDNLPTRYLLSDACVVAGKPLVSGAALGAEGQLTIYNHKDGPCYRCLFPVPPPEGARQRCSDNGVIGIVPGVIGTFEALEALKLASGIGETLSSRMLILDALSTRIHMVRLRGRNSECCSCGNSPQILASNLPNYDYEAFTRSSLSDQAPERQQFIPETDRISSPELKKQLKSGQACLLLDVRDAHEHAISSLPNSINIPFSILHQKLQFLKEITNGRVDCGTTSDLTDDKSCGKVTPQDSGCVSPPIYVVCRRGNDSQRAVLLLKKEGFSTVVDVVGGLESWHKNVDPEYPCY